MSAAPPLRVRFEIPRSELARASGEAEKRGAKFNEVARAGRFDETQLLGRVTFEINAPLVSDPVLTFLETKRGLKVEPPFTVALHQPVGYALGQLASAAVLALYGEGSFSLPLKGGRGALSVAFEAGSFDLGVPLEQYAGIVALPPTAAAAAIGEAASALAAILRGTGPLAQWALTDFLDREARILNSFSSGPAPIPANDGPVGLPRVWSLDRFAREDHPALTEVAIEAERKGAHVVPYWRATRLTAGAIGFEPLRPPQRGSSRGALARFLLPGADSTLEVEVGGDPGATERLRARLKRPTPFRATAVPGAPLRIEEGGGALPLA